MTMSEPREPLVSVAVPVRNGENFLADALDSLLAQTYEHWEALVSDNASTDATGDIARAFARRDERIRYERHAHDLGAAPNYNHGFHHTVGQYLKWLAHDDVCRPEFLEAAVDALQRHPDAVVATSLSETIDEHGATVVRCEPHPGTASPGAIDRCRAVLEADRIDEAVFGLMRRSAVARTRLHGSYTGSDRTFMVELAMQGPFVVLPEPHLAFREHAGRSTRAFIDSTQAHPREAWFDTSRANRVVFPNWRRTGEFVTAIHRSGLPARDRRGAYGVVAQWLLADNWKRLANDIRLAGRDIGGRVAARVRASPSKARVP